MSRKDYYKILGVPEDASVADIKKAYRKLALKYHPDRVPEEKKKEAEARFKEISEAYYCLSDKERRREYDEFRRGGVSGFQGDFAQAHGFDFDEILRHFRGFHQGRGSSRRASYGSAFDIEDLFDIVDHMGQGSRRTYVFGSSGAGAQQAFQKEQTDVHATLHVPEALLKQGGEARFSHQGKEITLKIKPGTKRGQKLRLREQGRPCPCCHKPGDLIVTVQ